MSQLNWRSLGLAGALCCGCGSVIADGASPDASAVSDVGDASTSDASDAWKRSDTSAGRLVGDAAPCGGDTDPECRFACLDGVCCNGQVVDGKCICGEGAGCDILHFCCVRKNAPTPRPPECVDELFQCAGDW